MLITRVYLLLYFINVFFCYKKYAYGVLEVFKILKIIAKNYQKFFHLPYCSLRIAFQSKTRLCSLFRFNDIILKEISSHLVYKFMCSCCNATYYGESERHFFVRASEHLGMTPLTGKRVKNPKKSAIFNHILLKGHDASFEDFTILLKENNKFKLHLKESLRIKRDKPELNRNICGYPLEFFD